MIITLSDNKMCVALLVVVKRLLEQKKQSGDRQVGRSVHYGALIHVESGRANEQAAPHGNGREIFCQAWNAPHENV